MLVKEIMTEKPITVTGSMEIIKAARLLLENRINGVPVVDDDGIYKGYTTQHIVASLLGEAPRKRGDDIT